MYVTVVPQGVMTQAVGSDGQASLVLQSAVAQAFTVFVNGAMVGTGNELSHRDGTASITCQLNMQLAPGWQAGDVTLALLSTSLGIGNGGGVNNGATPDQFSSTGVKGITSQKPGSVKLNGQDLTQPPNGWTHLVGRSV